MKDSIKHTKGALADNNQR